MCCAHPELVPKSDVSDSIPCTPLCRKTSDYFPARRAIEQPRPSPRVDVAMTQGCPPTFAGRMPARFAAWHLLQEVQGVFPSGLAEVAECLRDCNLLYPTNVPGSDFETPKWQGGN